MNQKGASHLFFGQYTCVPIGQLIISVFEVYISSSFRSFLLFLALFLINECGLGSKGVQSAVGRGANKKFARLKYTQ